MRRKKDDVLLKSAFEEAFPDLLRFFFKDADEIFDLSKEIHFLDKELSEIFPSREKRGGSRFVDLLAKVAALDGGEKWILVHIEIQAAADQHFGLRMFQYFYRIFDRYHIPVTAFSVFTGKPNVRCKSRFEYNFLGTNLSYQFNKYQIFDHTEQQLLGMKNRFALVVLAAQKVALPQKYDIKELANQRLRIAKSMIESGCYDDGQIKSFLYFLKSFIYIPDKEINSIFEKKIVEITNNRQPMGIIETIEYLAREEGYEKGVRARNRKFIKNLLTQTDHSIDKIAMLADVQIRVVERVRLQLEKAASKSLSKS